MTDGVGTSDTPLRHAGRGPGGGDGTALHHRATLPVDRSVLWTPSRDPGDPGGPAASGPYELFLARSVVREIDVHSSTDGRDSHFGFLLGHLYRCPDTGVHYAVADLAVPSAELVSEDAPDPFLLTAWADSHDERFLAGLRRRGLFELAEKYCVDRLANSKLDRRRRATG